MLHAETAEGPVALVLGPSDSYFAVVDLEQEAVEEAETATFKEQRTDLEVRAAESLVKLSAP